MCIMMMMGRNLGDSLFFLVDFIFNPQKLNLQLHAAIAPVYLMSRCHEENTNLIRPSVEEPQEVKQSSSNWRPPAQYCLFHLKIKMFFYLQSLVSHFATEKIAVKISNDFS